MAHKTPITIKAALHAVQTNAYVLPAIQREFTWRPDQICRLFDSLMQGYPIGSFLFWKVKPEESHKYTWYGILRDYNEHKNRLCPVLDLPERDLTAILDGQQRLTSLNIGLRGSHAEKEPRKRRDRPESYPIKYLFLNLCATAPEDELGLKYAFRFLTKAWALEHRSETFEWFQVSDVYDFSEPVHVFEKLQELGIPGNKFALKTLNTLYRLVHDEPLVPYFEEEAQDLDKVLNIFIRVNSAGTPLSYSDLLLSIATAKWSAREDDVDARQAVRGLVEDLNKVGQGFDISKDLVLKAGLMLADIQSVAFRVTNFNSKNMATLEAQWTQIERSLRAATELLASYGLSRQNLAAHSVLIPVAYYLHKRNLDEHYVASPAFRADRELVRGWVYRSLVKIGIWGSGLDSLLLALRTTIDSQGHDRFPVKELEEVMARRGKSLGFTEEELRDLLDSEYGDPRTFILLALLFPHMDMKNLFHVDHVFPKSKFTRAQLRDAGIPEGQREAFIEMFNRLANLQLLEGLENIDKRDSLPAAWLTKTFKNDERKNHYCATHDLGLVPDSLVEFEKFYLARRERLEGKLKKVLGLEREET